MNGHFGDYYWKNGKPYGKEKLAENVHTSYKIVADPYYKRISIEKYQNGNFSQLVYDSFLLDFRHLNSAEQAVWHRETLSESRDKRICLLRNQDDRAILTETLHFESNLCRLCQIHSIHGIHLSTHHMHYKNLNDSFDGVILFDCEERPVMQKIYQFNEETQEFDHLLY